MSDMETRLAIAERDIKDHDDLLKSIGQAVSKISDSMQAIYLSLQKHDQKNEVIERIFTILEKQDHKINTINEQLPELKLTSGLIKKAVIAILSMVLAAVVGLVIKG
jgi:hypothetical protein